MTHIMMNLEGRFYRQGHVIVQEQDECLEVLFVLRGRYNIGYEINRKRRFRKQFGPSTLIGAFQMSFLKRYQFLIVAQTDMLCYVLRREQWFALMEEYPDFCRIIKQKSFHFYVSLIQRPLMKLKNKEITKYEQRKDYLQVLATPGETMQETKCNMHKMYQDVEVHLKKYTHMIIEQGKIIWLLSTIDRKFNIFLEKAFDIAHITEYIISILWNRIINAIAKQRIKNPKKFTQLFHKIIYPDDVCSLLSAEQYFKLREYGKWHELISELYRSINGDNQLKFIREELIIQNIQKVFDDFMQKQQQTEERLRESKQ